MSPPIATSTALASDPASVDAALPVEAPTPARTPTVETERALSDDGRDSPTRRLGLTTATLQVVASMVGTGIFTTTGLLVRDLGSPTAVLVVWLIGGLLALCGALAYSELAAALPVNGGEYALLSRVFHPGVGFVAGWISLVVGFSAPIAASALAFGQYVAAIFPGTPAGAAAVALVVSLALLHALHLRMSSGLQNAITIAIAGLIVAMVIGGLMLGDLGHITTDASRPAGEALLSPAFPIALVYVSFAYSGWNGTAYLAGEVRRPARTIPRALCAGTLGVVLLFVGLNVMFLASAPADELSGVVEIGHVAARRLFGSRAGAVLSGVIALALVSSVSAMMLAGPRVVEAMGKRCRRLSLLGNRSRGGTPALAIMLQAGVAVLMVVTATFEVLLTYIGFTLSLVAGLTVLGVVVLRIREPGLARPYRAWGYPVTPLLFVGLSAWMVLYALVERPSVALAGLATVASGVVLYLLLGRGRSTRAALDEQQQAD